MSKKYLNRALVWSLLVIGLIIVTFYNNKLFIKPLKDEINSLKQAEISTNKSILEINAQIDKYNSLRYDNGTINLIIPQNDNLEEIIQKYALRPLNISNGKLLNISITDGMPKNIKLSNDISGKRVSLSFQINDINQLYTFIDELNNSVRSIYFGNISFTLPGEAGVTSDNPIIIKVQIDYYLFYTKPDVTKNTTSQ